MIPCPSCVGKAHHLKCIEIMVRGIAHHCVSCSGCGMQGPHDTSSKGAVAKWDELPRGDVPDKVVLCSNQPIGGSLEPTIKLLEDVDVCLVGGLQPRVMVKVTKQVIRYRAEPREPADFDAPMGGIRSIDEGW